MISWRRQSLFICLPAILSFAFYSQQAMAQNPVAETQVQIQWSNRFSTFDTMKPAIEQVIGKALDRQARNSPACLDRATGASQNTTPAGWLIALDTEEYEFTFSGGSGSWWLVRLSVSRSIGGKAFIIPAPRSQVLYDFDDFPPLDQAKATDFLSDLLEQVARQFEECERNDSATDRRQDDVIAHIRHNVIASNQPAVEELRQRYDPGFVVNHERDLTDDDLIKALAWHKALGGWYARLAEWGAATVEGAALAKEASYHLQQAELAGQKLEDQPGSVPLDQKLPGIYRLNREISTNLLRVKAPASNTPMPVPTEVFYQEADTYIGDRMRIALGYDSETDLTGEFFWDVLEDKDHDTDKALSFEGWKGSESSGGLKMNYHWLGGNKDQNLVVDGEGRKYYQDGAVRKLFLAADWNIYGDGKVTLGGGAEQRDTFWSAYASMAVTGERFLDRTELLTEGVSSGLTVDLHPWTQTDTLLTITNRFAHPYEGGLGIRVGRYMDGSLMRLQGGLDYEFGDFNSSQWAASINLDKRFMGTSQGLSLRLEVLGKQGDFETDQSDVRFSLLWSYDFGRIHRRLEPVPAECLPGSYSLIMAEQAWIRRALRNSAGHKRTVDYYRYDRVSEQSDTEYVLTNQGPQATGDSYQFKANTSGNEMPVLSNDSDPENDDLAIASFTQPANGKVELQGSLLLYTPNPGFAGMDSFAYTIEDRHTTTPHPPGPASQATVSITVDPGSVLAADDQYTVQKNSKSNPLRVLENDSDPDGDAFGIIKVSRTQAGSVEHDSMLIFYSTQPGSCAADAFEYEIEDAMGVKGRASVAVNILNQAPNAMNDQGTTCIDTPVVINVLANDTDSDGDPLTVSAFDATSQALGTVKSDGQGNLTYLPAPGWTGVDSFQYTITDDCGVTSSATVTVVVTLD